MDNKIREKMIKCLELTASDADGEALNAIRMANKQRAKLGLSWEQVLNGGGSGSSRSHARPGAGSYDYYNTDPFSEGLRRGRQRAQEQEEQRRAQEEQQRAWKQQQERAASYRRQQRPNAANDTGNNYEKPSDKDWDDVWGV